MFCLILYTCTMYTVLLSERTNSDGIQPGTDITFPRMNELRAIGTAENAPVSVKIPGELLQQNFDGLSIATINCHTSIPLIS